MIPERIAWAVETLAVAPDDRLLEIGCGPGVAAASICERLGDGKLVAIDRSTVQIERARKRNEEHLAAGRLELAPMELADLDLGNERFDKVFAINVNVFWTGAARRELERIRAALEDDGTLFLFYELPNGARGREIAARIARSLAAAEFRSEETLASGPRLFCSVSRMG